MVDGVRVRRKLTHLWGTGTSDLASLRVSTLGLGQVVAVCIFVHCWQVCRGTFRSLQVSAWVCLLEISQCRITLNLSSWFVYWVSFYRHELAAICWMISKGYASRRNLHIFENDTSVSYHSEPSFMIRVLSVFLLARVSCHLLNDFKGYASKKLTHLWARHFRSL